MPALRTVIFLTSLLPHLALAQPAQQAARFDVVSIHRSTDASSELGANPPVRNGRLKYTHVSLKAMLTEAFPVDLLHIRGGASWTGDEPYDVEATTTELTVPPERYRQMVQAMLADRFQLVTHFEQRQESIYYLTIDRNDKNDKNDKKGSRLTPTPEGSCVPVMPDGPPPPPDRYCGRYPVVTRQHFEGIGMRMAKLAEMLTFVLGVEVIDRTGLTEIYNVRLDYARPGDPAVPDGPPSSSAPCPTN